MNLGILTGQTHRNAVPLALLGLLVTALFLGGASQRHELRLAIIEIVAIVLLMLALAEMLRAPTKLSPLSLGLLGGLLALPLFQLIPVPGALWAGLPGRDQPALALELAGVSTGWRPISLSPEDTWRSFLALLPPVAMILGAASCTPAFRLRNVHAILIFTALSLVVAGAQTLLGGNALHMWPTTNPGTVVGLFANRNHLATLCVLSLPFAAVMGAQAMRRPQEGQLPFWLSILFLGSSILALAVIRSLMGLILLLPALGGSLMAAWIASGRGRPGLLYLGLIAGAVAAVAAVAIIALPPVLERFDNSGAREGRFENWPTVLEAANTYLPLGSGLGSFDAVYRSVEPLVRLDSDYFNQAHNDYLETWLEAGWPGIILLAAFMVWYARRSWTAWRAGVSTAGDIQRAASVAIGVVLLHSAVDYPLRTETISVIFAFCCLLLETAGWSAAAEPAVSRRNDAVRLDRRPRAGSF